MAVDAGILLRFQELFSGGDHAHGVWEPDTRDCRTEKTPATDEDFRKHLEGELGLGIVPINTKGECRWGAIDIDDDAVNHAALYEKAARLKLPLNMFRSKSGGAHAILFTREPVKSSAMIAALKKCAIAIGYPRAEIFPKQAKVSTSNLGNWLNVPFFANGRTVRYAVGPNGALTLQEFLDSVVYWDGREITPSTPEIAQVGDAQMPPCLTRLTQEGLKQGERDLGLFNLAIFYRKSSPPGDDTWPDRVVAHNQQHITPPLTYKEVEKIIKSVGQRTYQYKCNEEPLCSRCDRGSCVKLPFGVAHKPWESDFNFPEVSHLRKHMTKPPYYTLCVNGVDITLQLDELASVRLLSKKLLAELNLVVRMKQDTWDEHLSELLTKVVEIEAPDNASEEGMVFEEVLEFLALFERAYKGDGTPDREMLLRGKYVSGGPVEYGSDVAFRVTDVQRRLKHLNIKITNRELYQLLKQHGCRHPQGGIKVCGKLVKVWLFPRDKLNLQTEDFAIAEVGRPPLEDDDDGLEKKVQ
ncbi:MAG: TOTE conflict system archaeo-eukaryotic primase domain-containing protein [Terriglobales bacterium]